MGEAMPFPALPEQAVRQSSGLLIDGQPHAVRVVYAAGQMRVHLDGEAAPSLTAEPLLAAPSRATEYAVLRSSARGGDDDDDAASRVP